MTAHCQQSALTIDTDTLIHTYTHTHALLVCCKSAHCVAGTPLRFLQLFRPVHCAVFAVVVNKYITFQVLSLHLAFTRSRRLCRGSVCLVCLRTFAAECSQARHSKPTCDAPSSTSSLFPLPCWHTKSHGSRTKVGNDKDIHAVARNIKQLPK